MSISTKKARNIIWGFAALLAYLCQTGCSFFPSKYTAEPISGVVLDNSTNKPLSGAVVVVTWYSQDPGLMHSLNREIFEIQEAVTDVEGHFTIPGWKQKKIDRSGASVDANQPEILIYKYGYKPTHRQNIQHEMNIMGNYKDQHGSIIRWYAPTEIKIDPLIGSTKEKIEALKDFEVLHPFPLSIYTCNWKKRINFLLEIDKQLEENEKYYFDLYKNNGEEENRRSGAYTTYEPWYLLDGYPPAIPECPGAKEVLLNARKLRSKNTK